MAQKADGSLKGEGPKDGRGPPKEREGRERVVRADPHQQDRSRKWAPQGALGQEMVVVRGQEGMSHIKVLHHT